MNYFLGAHIDIDQSLLEGAKTIKKYKGNIMQIMVNNSQQVLNAMKKK